MVIQNINYLLDYMITSINYNLATVLQIKEFLRVLNELDYNELYESVFHEIILNNFEFTEKLSLVVSFIIKPNNYYVEDEFFKSYTTKEEIYEFLNNKYNFSEYKRMNEEIECRMYDEINEIGKEKFTTNLYALVGDNVPIREFIDNSYKANRQKPNVSKICIIY